ncbi:transcriptional regulator ArgR [soil metagenome]
MSAEARDRRELIRELLVVRPIATQEELRAVLAERGYDVTQATLSRDLAQLGARRAASGYELPAVGPTQPLLPDLVRSIDDNGTLVVIHTAPGAAQIIASALDRAKPVEILGTIAGDDAIFVAPARGVAAQKLAKRVRELVRSIK